MDRINSFSGVDSNYFFCEKPSFLKKAMVVTAVALSAIALIGLTCVCAFTLPPLAALASISAGSLVVGLGLTQLIGKTLHSSSPIKESSDSESIQSDLDIVGLDGKISFSSTNELRTFLGCDGKQPMDYDLKQTCYADLKMLWVRNERLVSEKEENKIREETDSSVDALLRCAKEKVEKLLGEGQSKYLNAVLAIFSQAPIQMLSMKNLLANASSGSGKVPIFQEVSKKNELILSDSAPPKIKATIEGQVEGRAFTSEMVISFQNSEDVKGDVAFFTKIEDLA